MKFLVIGSSVIDNIITANNLSVKPGGIFYSALGLSAIQDNPHEFFMLTDYDDKNYNLFEKPFSKFDMSYSNLVDQISINKLKLYEDAEREEIYDKLPKALKLKQDIDFTMFDAIYINMITGYDITLHDLEFIRKSFDKLIYIDIHTLSRGFDEINKRVFRTIPRAELWQKHSSIIQVNESEFYTLSSLPEKPVILDSFFRGGGFGLVITKGDKGVEGYYKNGTYIRTYNIPPYKSSSLNSVGCGDVFGSIFFYVFATTNNFELALEKANKHAGIFSDLKDFNNFSVILEQE